MHSFKTVVPIFVARRPNLRDGRLQSYGPKNVILCPEDYNVFLNRKRSVDGVNIFLSQDCCPPRQDGQKVG